MLSVHKLEIKKHLLKGTNISHLLPCIEKASRWESVFISSLSVYLYIYKEREIIYIHTLK